MTNPTNDQKADEEGIAMTENRMNSFHGVWSYASFPFLLSPDFCRLRGPVPSTLKCPLERVIEGPKPIPR